MLGNRFRSITFCPSLGVADVVQVNVDAPFFFISLVSRNIDAESRFIEAGIDGLFGIQPWNGSLVLDPAKLGQFLAIEFPGIGQSARRGVLNLGSLLDLH